MPRGRGVGEAAVSGDACEHDAAGARGAGDRGGAGVAASAFAILVAVWLVAELAKYPGAEDEAKSRQTAQDLGVRVCLKASASSRSSSSICRVSSS